jgi:arylsulfatase
MTRPPALLAGIAGALLLGSAAMLEAATPASAADKPNILVIMGDDVGWFNIGAYHRGIMSGKTPNLDKLARRACCSPTTMPRRAARRGGRTSSPARFPLRTGLTTVARRAPMSGIPEQAVTLAHRAEVAWLRHRQFGKNHLGDLNKYLPTVHGFDEFFGYLYHLDAMSDPYWFDYPAGLDRQVRPAQPGPCWATDTDDPTGMPRWGKVGKQQIVDEGPLAPFPDMKGRQNWQEGQKAKYDMETFDEVLVESQQGFMDKAKKDGKPFFIWHNTTRMHVWTFCRRSTRR